MCIKRITGTHGYGAVWPPATADDRTMRSLEERIPKAANANDTIMQTVLKPSDASIRYKAQEKLNGVYVLWDGAQMWTKTGHPVDMPDAFRQFLPPKFALVGELFLGYGHTEFQFASTISRNMLPGKKTMEAGAESSRALVWQLARLVAFDTPIVSHLPYGQRYALLRQVIASWSWYITQDRNVHGSLLPLLVIVQYEMSALPALFREVVHGTAWSLRKHLPFGVPTVGMVKKVRIAGTSISFRPAMDTILETTEYRQIMFGADVAKECSGEGLMLWDQKGMWKPRGASGRPSITVLKYKPQGITIGTVVSLEPQHSHHGMNLGDEDVVEDRLPCYEQRFSVHRKQLGA